MYLTACTLHRWLRPMGVLHSGQGNEVLSFSTSGLPEDVQTTALLATTSPLVLLGRASPPFSVDCGEISGFPAACLFTSIL